MKWNKLLISGFMVWLVQLTIVDIFIIDTVRPDFHWDSNHVLVGELWKIYRNCVRIDFRINI